MFVFMSTLHNLPNVFQSQPGSSVEAHSFSVFLGPCKQDRFSNVASPEVEDSLDMPLLQLCFAVGHILMPVGNRPSSSWGYSWPSALLCGSSGCAGCSSDPRGLPPAHLRQVHTRQALTLGFPDVLWKGSTVWVGRALRSPESPQGFVLFSPFNFSARLLSIKFFFRRDLAQGEFDFPKPGGFWYLGSEKPPSWSALPSACWYYPLYSSPPASHVLISVADPSTDPSLMFRLFITTLTFVQQPPVLLVHGAAFRQEK